MTEPVKKSDEEQLSVNVRKRVSSRFTLEAGFSAPARLTVLFGPSGAGKTTLLRSVAGLTRPDSGKITLGPRTLFDSDRMIDVPAESRSCGYVFQNLGLFPHLTVEQNVQYGMRKVDPAIRRARAMATLESFGIAHLFKEKPKNISGGERQRVALARSLVAEPRVLLLDEPLSAVDVSTRSRLLQEIVEIQRRSAIPFIYVTHSPADAVRAGDWVLVLDQGRIVQEGLPLEVFNSPRSVPLARAVGTENIFLGTVLTQSPGDGVSVLDLKGCRLVAGYNGLEPGTQVTVGVRSEDIIVCREAIRQTSARNLLQGNVKAILRDGDKTELVVDCGLHFKVSITEQAIQALGLRPGVIVFLLIKASACHTLA